MSNTKTAYTYFDTYNFTNVQSTSSYALPFAEFTFRPRLDVSFDTTFSNKKVVWDFGDGTVQEAVTGRHAYSLPGTYNVTCIIFDQTGESYVNSFYQSIDVYNFINDSIGISVNTSDILTLTACRLDTPITITGSVSYQNLTSVTDNKTIIPYCSGSDVDYFVSGISEKSYSHLYRYSSFYSLETGLNQLTEFVEISSFQVIPTSVYCKLSGTSIVQTTYNDVGSFFCGITGQKHIYFKSDIPYNNLNLLFGYKTGDIKDNNNTTTVGIQVSVEDNLSFDKLSVNSNGITSEGITSDLFPISPNKFANTKIGFVVKAKDAFNFTNKTLNLECEENRVIVDAENLNFLSTTDTDYRLTPQDPLQLAIVDENNTIFPSVSFFTSFNNLTGLPCGIYKGYFIADIPLTQNVMLSAQFYDTVTHKTLYGTSSKFSIYPKDHYTLAKRGEDIDMTQQYKDVAIQPLFIDNTILFNDFVGSMVGNISSNIGSALGKRVYEKIDNFVDNNSTPDYASINGLAGLVKATNTKNIEFDRTNYLFPCDLGRLVDTLSINFGRLRGSADSFNQDFKTYGYQSRETYGKNIGNEIGINYTVIAGNDILAFEKYSGKFTLLNTFSPLCASNPPALAALFVVYDITTEDGIYITAESGDGIIIEDITPLIITYTITTENGLSITTELGKDLIIEDTTPIYGYQLSAYNETWGWGLVLPEGTTVDDISNYYTFYEHNPRTSDLPINGVINYNDITNTLSYNISSYTDWSKKDGIMSNILTNQLYIGLNLFN
jgi:hypothetical protein